MNGRLKLKDAIIAKARKETNIFLYKKYLGILTVYLEYCKHYKENIKDLTYVNCFYDSVFLDVLNGYIRN